MKAPPSGESGGSVPKRPYFETVRSGSIRQKAICNISSGSNPRASTVGCALSHRHCSVSRWSSEKPSKSQGVAIRVRLSGGESTAEATDMVTTRQKPNRFSRSEERRGGKRVCRQCKCRWLQEQLKTNKY